MVQRPTKHSKVEPQDLQKILAGESDFDKERYLVVIKKLKVENCFYKQKYNEEKELRLIADDKIIELEAEKKILEEELLSLKSNNPKNDEQTHTLMLPDLNKS